LQSLKELNLRNNQFTGEIPKSYGRLENLWCLYLDGNQLTGLIPRRLLMLPKLQILHFNNNNGLVAKLRQDVHGILSRARWSSAKFDAPSQEDSEESEEESE
ncbi:hypothetical protein HDU81_001850, partial [Chytriomyces hyalinus]